LTVEETFYLSAPFIFMSIRRRGIGATQAALWAVGLALLLVGTHMSFWSFLDDPTFVILYTFFGRSLEFVIGIACARWLLAHRERLAVSGWPKCTYVGIAGALLVIGWMSTLQSPTKFGLFEPMGMVLNDLLLPVFLGIGILGLVLERSIASRLLSTELFLILGRSSYAFYLLHMSVFTAVFVRFLPAGSDVIRMGLLLVAMNVASVLLYVLYERPANLLVKRVGSRLLYIGVETPSAEQYAAFRNRAIAAFCVLLLLFGFWNLHKVSLIHL
jgi:peptidoglycan/LPS O-acetylase OafA/YrhL